MDRDRRVEQRIARLLATLVALTSLLVIALGIGATLAWREYARVRAVLQTTGGELSARELAAEITQRQQVISSELAAMAKDSSRQIAEFERRAAHLRESGGGPIDTAKKAIEMTQLMADEMLLQLKLMATLNAVLEKTSRPLPVQRGMVRGGEPAQGRDDAHRGATAAGRRPPRP